MPPFQYSSAQSSPELRQGEILSDFWEYRPENPVSNRQQDSPIPVVPFFHKFVIVITQDCDLLSDHRQRAAGNHDHRNILRSLLLCELFEEGDIRDPQIFGTKEWRKVKQNQDERYHCFPAAAVDGSPVQLPEFYLDFKRITAACTIDLYQAIQLVETKRVALVPALYIHDLIHRFFAFHGRVALPEE